MRTAFVVLAVLAFSSGCVTVTENSTKKRIVFEQDSINLHPMAVSVSEVEGQGETTGTEMVFPDGSYVTLAGGGAAGNLTVVPMQNDGTDQDAKTDAKADVKADVDVTPGGNPAPEPVGRAFRVVDK